MIPRKLPRPFLSRLGSASLVRICPNRDFYQALFKFRVSELKESLLFLVLNCLLNF